MSTDHLNMKTKFLLIRHGQTDWNIQHRFQGQSDTPLNALGERQARQAGQALAQLAVKRAEQGEQIHAVVSSDLRRAALTARIICEALSARGLPSPEIRYEPRLREMSFGEWEGLTYTEIQSLDPAALERWGSNFDHIAPPGGETLNDLAGRIRAVQADLLAQFPAGMVLLVAHGGPLQLWIAEALGLPPGRFWQLHLENASISEMAFYPEGAILNVLNNCAHLD